MNPFSLYSHKAELVESVIVTGLAVAMIRRHSWRPASSAVAVPALAALAWGVVGVLDYLLYALGYQLAGWSRRDTSEISRALEWLRVPIIAVVAYGVWAAARQLARRGDPAVPTKR